MNNKWKETITYFEKHIYVRVLIYWYLEDLKLKPFNKIMIQNILLDSYWNTFHKFLENTFLLISINSTEYFIDYIGRQSKKFYIKCKNDKRRVLSKEWNKIIYSLIPNLINWKTLRVKVMIKFKGYPRIYWYFVFRKQIVKIIFFFNYGFHT